MNKQMRIELEKKQVRVNGLRQNCFVLDGRTVTPSVLPRKITHYVSLEKKELDNGFTLELEKVDYPITSESVTSYIETSDYRLDPNQAIANSPKRVNLGDVSQIQDFVNSNPQEAVRLYKSVGAKLQEYYKQKTDGEQAPKSDTVPPSQGE